MISMPPSGNAQGYLGHVAGVINPQARSKRSYWVNDDIESDPQGRFDAAEEKAGRWWPDWDAWMRRHSDGTVFAPTAQGISDNTLSR
jgi:polyhydroxyalkanoate synthase